ncbi:MAG: FliM/FliN family flagellar motor switch protein, partial [Pirellulales bacterium]
MAEFGQEIAADVLAACRQNAAQAAEAIGGLFEQSIQLEIGEPRAADAEALAALPGDGGLILLFEVGRQAAALLLPRAGGLLPEWCGALDAARQEQLDELAATVGKLLLPANFAPTRSECVVVADFAVALQQGMLAEAAKTVSLTVQRQEETAGALELIWPLGNAAALLPEPRETAEAVIQDEPAAAERTAPPSSDYTIERLPGYARSLLRIRVPVIAVLARRKQRVSELLELGPGAIIQFDKSCDQLLELHAG